MSIIGKQPITIPEKVEVKLDKDRVQVSGPNGKLDLTIPDGIKVEKTDKQLKVNRQKETKRIKSIHGTIRNLIRNMIVGVTDGWSKKLEVKGTGYKVKKQDDKLVFRLGFSHLVEFERPEGVNFEVDKNVVTVKGASKELVGNTAAKIKNISPPDIYKGKGIRYLGEEIKLKPGKVAKVGGAGEAIGG